MTYENGGQLDRALKRAVRDRAVTPGTAVVGLCATGSCAGCSATPTAGLSSRAEAGCSRASPTAASRATSTSRRHLCLIAFNLRVGAAVEILDQKRTRISTAAPTRKSGLTKHRRSAARVLPEGDRLLCGLGRGGRAGVRCHQPQAPQAPGVQDALRGPLLRGVAVALRIQARKGASKGILTTL